ncbi:MAG TPA: DUF983 domain-containing protein [Flavobacteriales bacterium]|nr:DUF983 domain-containing protein [Flavobacteriales bacterium]
MFSLKGTKLYSILWLKCPFCQEGDFFISHPYDLKNAGKLHATCPVCHRKYDKEHGFYWGAMFVSYGLSILFIFSIIGLAWWLFPTLDVAWWLVIAGVGMVLGGPWLYAVSKILWANLFFHYQGPRGAR